MDGDTEARLQAVLFPVCSSDPLSTFYSPLCPGKLAAWTTSLSPSSFCLGLAVQEATVKVCVWGEVNEIGCIS